MENSAKNSSRLNVKDLINVGLFTALYFVLFMVSAATSYIPIMLFAFTVVCAVLAGIPMILFLSRIKKFGMVTIMCILLGVITFLMGYGPVALVLAVLCGLLADFILKLGQWQSWWHMLAAYLVFSLWPVGTLVPILVMGDAYFEGFRDSLGDAYVHEALEVMHTISGWLVPSVIVLTLIAALAGAYIGKAVFKKHFVRAGIA